MEKIKKIKKLFEKEKIDGYIIPKNDDFSGNMYHVILID